MVRPAWGSNLQFSSLLTMLRHGRHRLIVISFGSQVDRTIQLPSQAISIDPLPRGAPNSHWRPRLSFALRARSVGRLDCADPSTKYALRPAMVVMYHIIE